ncbi:MAG: hypothetical protein UV64_C0007G0038 [Parcubacteria group bacterium GW2011_GWC1_43_11b]|nr:MAG: hypothetical protein UV64_C0007G0038 [Parcubacteria group bacterium GW2011_GWC1_43_11b]
MSTFPLDEYLSISRKLEEKAILFSRFWEVGKPVFTDEIKTAAVHLNKENDILEFQINEAFWNSLDENTKIFVICHEMGHITLRHGSRGEPFLEQFFPEALNVAMDISINHLLVKYFGFKREEISIGESLCWIDTVFPPTPKIFEDQTFDYYLQQMKNLPKGEDGIPMAMDNPSGEGKAIEDWLQGKSQEDAGEKITQEEIEETAGKLPGNESNIQWQASSIKVVEKKKWMSLIKNWNKKALDEEESEQWTRVNRRLSGLQSDFFLPSDNSSDDFGKKKVEIYLFLDISGSCSNANTQFVQAAKSIPKKHFEIHAYVFDTRAKEINLQEKKIYDGGGTSFSCIEDALLSRSKYPEVVWVFTDGEANPISPKHPERWSWFLLPGGKTRHLPRKSKVYKLADFE